MPKHADWIPTKEEKLVILILIWRKKLPDAALQTLYAWLAAECTLTDSALEAFINAREAYLAAPTMVNRTEKDERKKAAVEAMRKFARERIRNNSAMSDAQKQELGVTVSDREPSPVSVPELVPESLGSVDTREPGVVKVRYLGAKPYGVDRVEIAWSISETAIDTPEKLAKNDTFSRNPWERIFPSEEWGKKLYYSLRYLAREGASHWSSVRELIIP
jgi:hypothetical protein